MWRCVARKENFWTVFLLCLFHGRFDTIFCGEYSHLTQQLAAAAVSLFIIGRGLSVDWRLRSRIKRESDLRARSFWWLVGWWEFVRLGCGGVAEWADTRWVCVVVWQMVIVARVSDCFFGCWSAAGECEAVIKFSVYFDFDRNVICLGRRRVDSVCSSIFTRIYVDNCVTCALFICYCHQFSSNASDWEAAVVIKKRTNCCKQCKVNRWVNVLRVLVPLFAFLTFFWPFHLFSRSLDNVECVAEGEVVM